MFFLGLILFFYVGGSKLYYTYNDVSARNIADMSSFYIALTSMLMGVQLFLAGFIGEMISRNAEDRNQYHIEESI